MPIGESPLGEFSWREVRTSGQTLFCSYVHCKNIGQMICWANIRHVHVGPFSPILGAY